jgi:hypothetical protein
VFHCGNNLVLTWQEHMKLCKYKQKLKSKRCVCEWDFFFFTDQAALKKDRTLTIIGIVIGVLVFVCICIASYVLAK